MKKDMPLNSDKNVNQTCRSSLTSCFKRIKWFGRFMPIVRSVRRRKKARPSAITEQAKFKRPNSNWSSFSATFFLLKKRETTSVHLQILSAGRRASKLTESNSMPANVKVVLQGGFWSKSVSHFGGVFARFHYVIEIVSVGVFVYIKKGL